MRYPLLGRLFQRLLFGLTGRAALIGRRALLRMIGKLEPICCLKPRRNIAVQLPGLRSIKVYH